MNNLYLKVLLVFCFAFPQVYQAQTAGNALQFDGVDDHVVVSPTIPYSNSYTLEAWVNFTGTSATIFGWGNNAINGYVDFSILNSRIRFAIGNILSSIDQFDGNTVIASNTWNHVAVVKNGNSVTLYLNGVEDGTFFTANTPPLITSSIIGAGLFNGIVQGFSEKTIDELRIWNVARTQSEISANRNCNINPQIGLLSLYRFNQGLGGANNVGINSLTDNSGNNRNGTLTNFSLSGPTSNWVNSPIIPLTGNYRSTGSGSFSTLSNWETQVGDCWEAATELPSVSSNNIIIRNGHTITINNAVNADQIIIEPSGTLDINNGATLTLSDGPGSDLVVNGTFNLNNNGTLTGNGVVLVNGSATFNLNAGTISGSVSSTILPSGTLNITGIGGTTTLNNNASITNSGGTINWTGAGNINCGAAGSNVAITNEGSFLMNASANFTNTGGGIFFITNTSSGSILRNASGNTTITPAVGFVNQGSLTNSLATSTITIQSTDFNLANGSSLVNDGTINITAGSDVDFTGFTDISGTGTININGGLVRVANSTNVSGLLTITVLNAGVIEGSGTLQFNLGSTFNWTSGILRGSGNINTASGSTMNINGGGNTNILQSTRSLNLGGTTNFSTTGNIVYSGAGSNVTINNTGTFNISNTGDFTDLGTGSTLTFNNSGSLVKTNGTTSFLTGSIFNNSGSVAVLSGVLDVSQPGTTQSGLYLISSGAELTGQTIVFTGSNFTNNGLVSNNEISFSGSSAQTLAGNGTMQTLRLNNPNGLNLTGNQSIFFNLHLGSGLINTGLNTLIIDGNTNITGVSPTSYINGRMRQTIPLGNTATVFPVGNATSYTPVNCSFNSVSVAGNLTVGVVDGDHPEIASSGLNSNRSLNRHFTFSNQGIVFGSYTATFIYEGGDYDVGANSNNFTARLWDGVSWGIPSSTTAGQGNLTIPGLTDFFEVAIAEENTSPLGADFRSAASGDWFNNTTWEYFDGNDWVASPISPDETAGSISIQNGHNVEVSFANLTIDETTIQSGGILTTSFATITYFPNENKPFIQVNGLFNLSNSVVNGLDSPTGVLVITGDGQMNASFMDANNLMIENSGTIGCSGNESFRLSNTALNNLGIINIGSNLSLFGNSELTNHNLINVNANIEISSIVGGVINNTNDGDIRIEASPIISAEIQNNGEIIVVSGNQLIHNAPAFPIGGTIVVQPGAQLTSPTSIQMNAATVVNDGEINANPLFFTGVSTAVSGIGSIRSAQLINSSHIILQSNHTITETLDFAGGGKVITGSNTLTLLEGATILGNSSLSYIVGNLQRYVAISGDINFPVGDTNRVAELIINPSVFSPGFITVSTTGGEHPDFNASGLDANRSLNRFWTISNQSLGFSTASIDFSWTPADVDANANEFNFVVARNNGAMWSFPTTLNAQNGTLSATDILEFGDFAIAELPQATAANSLNFDGIDDEVVWGGTLVPFSNRPYSLSVWAKASGNPNNRTILSQGNNLWLAVNNFGDIQVADNWVTGAQFPNDNNWHNIIVVRDEQYASLYLDGVFVSQNDFPLANPGGIFVIGSSPSQTQFWQGSIDELRIWDKLLCSVEIQQLYNCAQTSSYPGLLAYYNFDQGFDGADNSSETTLIERINGTNNGSLINFSLTGAASNFTADAFPSTGNCPGVETFLYYRDADQDNFGDPNNSMWLNNACGEFPGYVLNNDDCDDNNPSLNPNALEVCNGIDDNCDGNIDNNNALNFDGLDDYVEIPEPAIGGDPFTIEFWMRPESFPFDQMYLVTNRTTESDNAGNWYRISMLQDGFIQAEFGRENQPSGLFLGTISQVALNTWNHVALTRSSDNTVSIYLNGILENSANDFPRNFASLNGKAYIGQWQGLGIATFDGSIDELRFWSVARTQNEIRATQVADVSGQPGLIRNYTFNQGNAGGENGTVFELIDAASGTNGFLDFFALSSDVSGSNWVNGFSAPVFADTDGDGFGDVNVSQLVSSTCNIPAGFVSDFSDCDDSNNAINPNASEIQNGVDDDCDGLTDEGFSNCNISLTSTSGNTVIICTESGATTGNVQLVVNNGLPPYTFGAQDSLNLAPGIYTFSVTDEAGCEASAQIELIQANCIVPYYQPPANDTISNLIGAELTQLFFFPQTFADSTIAENIFEIRQSLGDVLIEVISNVGQYETLLALLQTPEYGLNNLIDNGDSTLIITGFYPIENLKKLDSLPDLINYVRPYYSPIAGNFASTGLTTTQGDLAMGGVAAKNGWLVSGSGVKVGVLSDSYNTRTGNPAGLDVLNGDLPGTENPNYSNPVNVVLDYPFGRASDEGRAMLQIIHDIAPNADLYFRTGFVSAGNFAEGIKELADSGCTILVDDITYITEPYFQDGVIAKAVEAVAAQGVSYFTSAGNFGERSFEGVFNPTTAPSGYSGEAHDFGGGDVFQSISLEQGTYTIALQWEDDFYSLEQNDGAQNDLDIFLVDQFGNRLFGFNRNNLNGDPLEILPFVVRASVDANLIITRKSGSGNIRFKYIVFRGSIEFNEYEQGTATIIGQANAASAMSVGAVLFSNTPAYGVNPPTIASFSSRGGVLIDGIDRNKPDFCGPNGVNTTVPLGGVNIDGDAFPNFFGTSAAAPHIAAAAALIQEAKLSFQNESLNGSAMKALLQNNAIDMDEPGIDKVSGAGFVKVDAVLNSFSNPRPSLTSLQLQDPSATPGEQPIGVIINGAFFDEEAMVIFQYDTLVAEILSDSQMVAIIPAFEGNPPLTVFNPALTNSGLDGGLSDSLYFFGDIPSNVRVVVNSATKRFGEKIPDYEVSITVDNIPLAETNLTLDSLGLTDLTFTSSANNQSNVGLYFRRASSSVTDLSLPASQELANKFNYQFIDGLLTITRMPLTVKPKDTTLVYGASINGNAIQFDYQFPDENIDPSEQSLFLDSLIAAHQSTMSRSVILVDGKQEVDGRVLTEADLLNLSFFTSGRVAANTLSAANGRRAVNGIEFDTTEYVPLAPESIFDLQVDDANVAIYNALSAATGRRAVNGLTAANGRRAVNGDVQLNSLSAATGRRAVNGLTAANGRRAVNSNTFNEESNEDAVLLLDSLDFENTDEDDIPENDSIVGYTSMNLITGVEVGQWFIAPGVLMSENFDISYALGNLTITPKTLFVRAEDKVKACTDTSINFTAIKEFYQYEQADSNVVASGPAYTLLNALGQEVTEDALVAGVYQIVPSNLVQLDSIPNYLPVYEAGQLIVEEGVTATAEAGTITCFGGTTTVLISASGGTEPYSGIGEFTVSAGEFSFSVTDASGCSATISGNITQPGALPEPPTGLACWQTPVFNEATCAWEITGTQPEAPSGLACWQTPSFNTTTCSWEIIGTQPEAPSGLACWQIPSFNITSCSWEVTGTQPEVPGGLACWQTPSFNTATCAWEISGEAPIQPAVFADAIPQLSSAPFTGSAVIESRARWGGSGFEAVLFTPQNPGPPPAGVGLSLDPIGTPIWLDGQNRDFQFIYDAASGSATWSIDWNNNQIYGSGESVTSVSLELANTGFNVVSLLVQGGAVTAPAEGAGVSIQNFNLNGENFGNYTANNSTVVIQNFRNSQGIFGDITITGKISFTNGAGTAQERPRFYLRFGNAVEIQNLNCWDNIVLNNNTCSWENIGTQPEPPTNLACYQQTSFSTESCSWVITGTLPEAPTGLACWQTAEFDTSTCAWVISGTPPTPVVSTISACGSYVWPVNNQLYTESGTYTFEENCIVSQLVLTILNAPDVDEISGPGNSCAHQGSNGTLATYTVLATNATSYQWTIPSGATNVSGQGTSSISFRFPSSFANGTVSVLVSGCGNAIQRSIQVSRTAPATPGIVSGPAQVCEFRGTNIPVTYSIEPVANATSYTWTLPSGMTMLSGAGTTSIQVLIGANLNGGVLKVRANSPCGNSGTRNFSLNSARPGTPSNISGPNRACPGDVFTYSVNAVNNATNYIWTIPTGTSIESGAGTNNISLSFSSAFTGGTLSVRAANGCGQSNARSMTINRNAPGVPSAITGPASNLCGGGTFTYSISPVSGASSYNWTIPSGASMTANNGTIVTIELPANFSGGSIAVAAVNGCGSSTARSLSLNRLPSTPAPISGPTTVCRNQQNVTYSTQAIAGVSYTWTVPSGATIASGQGTASITVNFGTSNGNVSVRAVNACGNSSSRSRYVCAVACRVDGEMEEEPFVPELSLKNELTLFPNPGNGEFSLSGLISTEPAFIQIFASNGQLVESLRLPAESVQLRVDISKFASGLYLIRIEQANRIEELRYVKD